MMERRETMREADRPTKPEDSAGTAIPQGCTRDAASAVGRATSLEGVYDTAGNLLETYDPALGRLEERKKIVRHEAVEGVAEEGHYETVAEYPNGGKDVAWVVDVPGVEAREAWEEKVVFRVYVPYTKDELEAIQEEKDKPNLEEQIKEIKGILDRLTGGTIPWR